MKLRIFRIYFFVILFLTCSFSKGQGVPFCPGVTAVSSVTSSICSGGCAMLTASVVPVNQTNTYSIQSIPYTPFPYTGGTAVSVGTDDVWSPLINLGFNFCYFGNSYSQCILGSNGQLSFNTTLANGYDNWVISTAIPSLNDMPGNTICAPFRDIDPSFGGNMRYYFSGTSPCRALVIYWSNIPMYSNPGSCSGTANSTFQLVLYENTNFIDVYIQNSTSCTGWNSGYGIVGIQNAPGTVAYSPPNRNFPNTFTALNEGWRFVPTGAPNYTVTWTGPAGVLGTGLTQMVCPSSTTSYTATMIVGGCMSASNTYSSVVTVPVSSGSPPVITPGPITQLACGTSTNEASVSISGGTPGYTVNWSPSPTITGSTATSYSVTGLTPGTNTVSVTDASGCGSTATLNITPTPPVPGFSLSAPSGTVVGCNPSTVSLVATNTSTLSSLSYTWTSIFTGTNTGSSIGGQAPSGVNVYTVYAQDVAANSCIVTETIAVSQNTSVPGCTVNPIGGTLTCGGSPVTFTATSTTTTNVDGYWFDSFGNVIAGPTGSVALLVCTSPGTYVATFSNTINGCTSTKTVAVSANTIVPTMTINAPTGTKITCATPVLTLNITASPGPGPNTYTWTNLQTNISTNPATGGYTVNAPGTYSAAYQDGFGCKIGQQITITIDTVRPSPTAITNLPSGSFTLNCYNPVMTASAVTNPMLPITSYSWVQPSPSLVVATHTMEVNTTSVTANPTTFTVLAANPNGCVGRSKVLFYEDLVTPTYKVVFTPTALTCATKSVAVTPVYVSGPNTAANFTIASPPPTTTNTAPGSLFGIPGVYTATMMLLSNGCTVAAQQATVPVNTTPPATTTPVYPVIPCGSQTVNISAGTLTTSTSYSYAWSGPLGAGIGTPSANTTSVDQVGNYAVTITNTVNGCSSSNKVSVGVGTISAGFTADPTSGYAPLPVTFVNTSALGATTGTNPVFTSWSYGNGSVSSGTATSGNTFLNGMMNGSTTYSAAGVYTVNMYITQAITNYTCVSSASLVVTVDLPSKLTIPNVFTPNGDKVNDVFIVNSTNISEIKCIIFDRWGVKMYDVTSKTGNISWDGKNLSGKEAPSGTYFYIITATGLDDIPYEQKGTVSLFR